MIIRTLAGLAAAVFAVSPAFPAEKMACQKDEDVVSVKVGADSLAVYRHSPGPFKPYVKELYTPGGRQVLLDSPSDHIHHHGLMYAIDADGVDFWAEGPRYNPGKQIPRSDVTVDTARDDDRWRTTIRQTIDWVSPEGKPILEERRELIVHDPAGFGATVLTWSTRLGPAKGRDVAKLNTKRHYVGLGMRFVREMDREGSFLNSAGREGEVVRGAEKLVRAEWCAYTVLLDDEPVTVAMFDLPGNPRHPATWFTMKAPFAYLSATLNLHRQPMSLRAGHPVSLTYGVALWDGKIAPERIENTYKDWVDSRGQ